MQRMLQAAGPETPCIIRLASGDDVPIKKALDIGPAGIIVPQVNSARYAERVVQLSKYSPAGSRGIGIGRAHRYGLKLQEHIKNANDQVAVIIQAEHIDAVENIESIVAVPGIDAVFVGPNDLSASLGKPGQVDDPEVVQAIDRVTQTCLGAGMRLGIFGLSANAVESYIQQGYTLIVAGVDTLMLGQAASRLLSELKGGEIT